MTQGNATPWAIEGAGNEVTLLAAATVDIGAETTPRLLISGSGTTVTSLGNSPNRLQFLRFDGGTIIAHNPPFVSTATGQNLTMDATAGLLALSDNDGNYFVYPFTGTTMAGVEAPKRLAQNGRVIDTATTNAGYVSYQAVVADTRYIYLIQHHPQGTTQYIVKVDTFDFTVTAAINLMDVDAGLTKMLAAVIDGRYLYVFPHSGTGAKMARIDLTDFTNSGVAPLDLAVVDGGLNSGGLTDFDGRYLYTVLDVHLTGLTFGGLYLIRIDTLNYGVGGITSVQIGTTGSPGLSPIASALLHDENYIYYINYNSITAPYTRKVNRFAKSTLAYVDSELMPVGENPIQHTTGTAWYDGRYIYMSPDTDSPLLRLDTVNYPKVDQIDLAAIDSTLAGFLGACFQYGRYLFMPPATHTKVLRLDLLNWGQYATFDLANIVGTTDIGFNGAVALRGAAYFVSLRKVSDVTQLLGKVVMVQMDNIGASS